MTKRVKMCVEMEVTVAQGLALKAMFRQWNRLSSMGCSRMISFYVDGDGDFKPKCAVSFNEEMPELTPDMENAACVAGNENKGFIGQRYDYDYDPIAWHLRSLESVERLAVQLKEGKETTTESFETLLRSSFPSLGDKDGPESVS